MNRKGRLGTMEMVAVIAVVVVLLNPSILGTTPSAARVTKEGGFCGDDGEATLRVRAFKSVIPSTGVKTGVAITESGTTDGVFLMQGTEIIDIISANATDFQQFDKTIPCGQNFKLIIGQTGGTGYYYAESTEQTADSAIVKVSFDDAASLDEVGTITLSGKKSTVGDYVAATSTVGTDPHPLTESSSGGWNLKLDFLVEEASGKAVRGPALCFDYNTSAFQSMEVIGGSKLAAVPVSQNENEECWSIAGEDFLLKNYASVNARVNLEAKTIGQANNTINVTVIDFGNYLHNGAIVDGYEDASDANIHALVPTEFALNPVDSV